MASKICLPALEGFTNIEKDGYMSSRALGRAKDVCKGCALGKIAKGSFF